ncbi:MAG: universal stress protein [Bacteroidota bacterium]
MKNIIIPVDFSEDSLKGLELAVLFSKKIHVNIQLVYVQQKGNEYYAGLADGEFHYAEAQFQKIIMKYKPLLENDSKLRYIIKKGRIYREVVNQAQSYQESVLMASTHGASGFEEFFIGSNAFRIISATDRPVFTISKGRIPDDIKKIILPVDAVIETRQKVPFTANIAEMFGAEIHVVSVATSDNKTTLSKLKSWNSQVCNYLDGKGIKHLSKELVNDNLAEIIMKYSDDIQADLISIMTEQGSSFSNLFLGSYAHQVMNKANIPVLSITPHDVHLPRSFSTFGG